MFLLWGPKILWCTSEAWQGFWAMISITNCLSFSGQHRTHFCSNKMLWGCQQDPRWEVPASFKCLRVKNNRPTQNCSQRRFSERTQIPHSSRRHRTIFETCYCLVIVTSVFFKYSQQTKLPNKSGRGKTKIIIHESIEICLNWANNVTNIHCETKSSSVE